MDKKIKMVRKIMNVMLIASLLAYFAMQGFYMAAGVIAVAVGVFVFLARKEEEKIDERDIQIQLIATYCSFMLAICYMLVSEGVAFMKTGQVVPARSSALGLLVFSQFLLVRLFKKAWG